MQNNDPIPTPVPPEMMDQAISRAKAGWMGISETHIAATGLPNTPAKGYAIVVIPEYHARLCPAPNCEFLVDMCVASPAPDDPDPTKRGGEEISHHWITEHQGTEDDPFVSEPPPKKFGIPYWSWNSEPITAIAPYMEPSNN